jgi:hypothetical protein
MAKTSDHICFQATLHRPGGKDAGADWAFLRLPQEASDRLPARGLVSVEGTLQGATFAATLEPDGEGGHWLRVEPDMMESSGARPGETVELDIAPAAQEPEPKVPADLQEALDAAPEKARETWQAITPKARRDYIQWMVSAKKEETRDKRIGVAVDKLAKGDRRPCCFDRSGMYGKGLSCPVPAEEG